MCILHRTNVSAVVPLLPEAASVPAELSGAVHRSIWGRGRREREQRAALLPVLECENPPKTHDA